MVKRILSEIIVTALAFLIKMKNLSLYSLIKKKKNLLSHIQLFFWKQGVKQNLNTVHPLSNALDSLQH